MSHVRFRAAARVALLVLTCLAPAADAATLPPGFTDTPITTGLLLPTAMQFAPDGRLFVSEQRGTLRVIKNGVLLPTPFITLPVNSEDERGLLGVAFDPNFAANQFLYVYYTAAIPTIHNRISRFTASGDVAVPNSEVVLLDLPDLGSGKRNGGGLRIGPDGKLYAGVGDNSNGANAQSDTSLLGKMLRLNLDGTPPPDNPFYTTNTGIYRLIWAKGLRNPFTFAFNPSGPTPTMLINDVGQDLYDEINDGIAGANYGWPLSEGPTNTPGHTGPRYFYDHLPPDVNCAISGGAFYHAPAMPFPPDYVDDYFFADYCSGFIYKLDPQAANQVVKFASDIRGLVDLTVGADGNLYYLAYTGLLGKIDYDSATPRVVTQPAPQFASPGERATFSVEVTGLAPFSYQWQRDGVDIPGATSASYTTPVAALGDDGQHFRVRVTNVVTSVYSDAALLTVTTNQAALVTLTQPAASLLYRGGTVIAYTASAIDPDGGAGGGPVALPPSSFTWMVTFHHGTTSSTLVPPATGASGTFTIPATGDTATDVFYRLTVTVVDLGGRPVIVRRDLLPQVVQMTFQTSPASLQVRVDGAALNTPFTISGVTGIVRTIEAFGVQSASGSTYEFASWADGGAASRGLVTPPVNTTYTAIFRTASAITVPGSPDGLTATVNGQGVALGWTAALGAMTYRVEAGSAPGLANLFNADVGDVTLLQATAGPGAYFVRVRAANTIGVGPPSNEVRVTIDGGAACVTPPPAPANFSVQAAGLSAAFSWAPAPNATSYVLDVGSASGQSNLLSANVGAGTGYAAAGPAGTYYTRLRAVNACGASGPSQEAALTLGCTSAVPGPTGLTAIKANGILTLRWVGALGASSYRVRAGDGAGRTNLLDSDLGPATVQQFNLAGVPPGPYFVTIAAVGACGVSGASNEVLVQVP